MPRFLAIDWDQNQLHVVAGVAAGGKVKLQRAAVWREERPPNAAEAEAQGRLLRERLRSAGIAPAPVLACVGRDRVILKDLRFPAVPIGEEAGVVRFQAVKEMSDNPDDMVIDYVTVSPAGAAEQHALALIVRRDILNTYQKLCQAAGLKLAALTPRAFGVAAALKKAMAGAPPTEGAVAAVVIGERWAEFCMVRGETPLLSRSLAVGPGLAGEVRRNLTVFAGQAGRPPVVALYVAGAGPELRERLAEMTDVPVREFDPLAGATGLDVPTEAHGAFAGAVGLLASRAEPRALPINFVAPRQPRPPRDPNNRRMAVVAAAALIAFVGLGYLLWMVYANAQMHLRTVQQQSQDRDALLLKARTEDKLFNALDNWDNVVWLDELYDLTDRIPDVNALRISQVTAEPLTRTAKAQYTARIILKGAYYGDAGQKALNDLIDGFKQDGYYSPEGGPKLVGNQFTLSIKVARRPPTEYHRALKSAGGANANDGFDDGGFLP